MARLRTAFAIPILAAAWLAALLFGGPLSAWDGALLALFHPEQRGWIAETAFVVTWLGDWLVLVPLALAAAVVLWRQGRRYRAGALVVTVLAVRILVGLQKRAFGRPRPDVEQWMVEHSASFPSGHAANGLATLLAIAILLPQSPGTRRLPVALALACAVAVGASRVVLGVHWPSDVIGGWAFALLATWPLWSIRGEKPA